MRSRLIAVFVVGVLVGAVLLGGGGFALQAFGDEAEAQGGATWQYQYWSDTKLNGGDFEPNPDVFIDDWVQELPAECDFQFLGDARNVIFYRCPAS